MQWLELLPCPILKKQHFKNNIFERIFENLISLVYSADPGVRPNLVADECRRRLPKHLWPARIKSVSSVPQLLSGKVDRLLVSRIFA